MTGRRLHAPNELLLPHDQSTPRMLVFHFVEIELPICALGRFDGLLWTWKWTCVQSLILSSSVCDTCTWSPCQLALRCAAYFLSVNTLSTSTQLFIGYLDPENDCLQRTTSFRVTKPSYQRRWILNGSTVCWCIWHCKQRYNACDLEAYE